MTFHDRGKQVVSLSEKQGEVKMTIVPKRLGVKFSLKQEPRIQPKNIVPIFQRWIQDHTVDGMLIDVIDYKTRAGRTRRDSDR